MTATSYLNNLCVFLLFSIVTEDGQKIGQNVYLLNKFYLLTICTLITAPIPISPFPSLLKKNFSFFSKISKITRVILTKDVWRTWMSVKKQFNKYKKKKILSNLYFKNNINSSIV